MQVATCGTVVSYARPVNAAAAWSGHLPLGIPAVGQSAGMHLSAWAAVPSSVVSGVLVAVLLSAARVIWHRTRVPSALSRRVRRRSYLGAVLAASRRPEVLRLDVYTPRLLPARGDESIKRIQTAWEQINKRGKVRIITLDLEECLHAGAELLDRGIEVRVLPNGRGLGTDGLTFHLFETSQPDEAIAIVNHHHRDADRPIRIKGAAPNDILRSRFRTEWENARPLESVAAERIRPRTARSRGRDAVMRSIDQAETTGLRLGAHSSDMILPHLAFRDSCTVVFLIGLPGAGKSYIRSRLVERLSSMRLECRSLSDYPYAYLDLMRSVLKLNPSSGNGFRAFDGGAFAVQSEKSLLPALRALHANIQDASQACEVTLIEFARADLAAALQEFDDIRSNSRVIYVRAPVQLRQARLENRAVPPELRVNGQKITLTLSDDHLLPSSAERALYAADSLDSIKSSARWRDRIFEIDNEVDGTTHVDAKISEFVATIIDPYRTGHVSTPRSGQLVPGQP